MPSKCLSSRLLPLRVHIRGKLELGAELELEPRHSSLGSRCLSCRARSLPQGTSRLVTQAASCAKVLPCWDKVSSAGLQEAQAAPREVEGEETTLDAAHSVLRKAAARGAAPVAGSDW